MLLVRILPWTRFFCNVRLFRVPRSWTGSVQMKSSMTFIRGNRCIEREKDNFKSGEIKRLKECALALTHCQIHYVCHLLYKAILSYTNKNTLNANTRLFAICLI